MFDKITIVSVQGQPGDAHDTLLALEHSAQQLPGAPCLLLSPERPPDLPGSIRHIPITPLRPVDRSLFVASVLHQFIETDYALLVQGDSWVLDGAAFTPDFFEFDYLGAPAHMAEIVTRQGRSTKTGFGWVRDERSHQVGVKVNYLMNGAFSLRSQKFLKTPAALELDYRLRPPEIRKSRQGAYHMAWPRGDVNEDVYLCVLDRARMEETGIRFAPLCVGLKFAFEHLNPTLHANLVS